jgi:hypothetical protein
MDDISDELLLYIASYLDPTNLSKLSVVCSHLCIIAEDNCIWHNLLISKYPILADKKSVYELYSIGNYKCEKDFYCDIISIKTNIPLIQKVVELVVQYNEFELLDIIIENKKYKSHDEILNIILSAIYKNNNKVGLKYLINKKIKICNRSNDDYLTK